MHIHQISSCTCGLCILGNPGEILRKVDGAGVTGQLVLRRLRKQSRGGRRRYLTLLWALLGSDRDIGGRFLNHSGGCRGGIGCQGRFLCGGRGRRAVPIAFSVGRLCTTVFITLSSLARKQNKR